MSMQHLITQITGLHTEWVPRNAGIRCVATWHNGWQLVNLWPCHIHGACGVSTQNHQRWGHKEKKSQCGPTYPWRKEMKGELLGKLMGSMSKWGPCGMSAYAVCAVCSYFVTTAFRQSQRPCGIPTGFQGHPVVPVLWYQRYIGTTCITRGVGLGML